MPSPRRTTLARSLACATAMCVAVLMSPTAQADPSNPVIPSKQSIAAAQQRVAERQSSVASIEAQLADADTQLQSLGVAAGAASEAYDGAVYRWQRAQHAAVAARARANRAIAAAALSRSSLAGYVVSHDTTSTSLNALTSAMSATGTAGLINQLAGADATSAALDARFQRWQAATRLARVYQAQAARALQAATAAKQAAAVAKQEAAAAVEQQQAAVSSITAQRATLVTALAAAQHTSVRLAAQRVAGLEERRQERLAEARRLAELKAQREAARQQRLAEERQQRREQRQAHQPTNPGNPGNPGQGPTDPGQPPQQPPPHQPPSGGAATAIAFAYQQLGDPYVYGAAGPDAWDCSGLTMGSWAAAGVYLPHYAVAQYEQIEHITFSELRPGDLVFWGSSSDPSSIYHVAIYIGNGQIIQAPHPGAYVEVSGIYDWILPNFFGRP